MLSSFSLRPVLVVAVLIAPVGLQAQEPAAEAPPFTVSEVAPGLSVLSGQGGNIGVFVGPDATVIVDDQMAPVHEALMAHVSDLADGAPAERTFVLNTHFHGDHTGGNEQLGEIGSIIVAHHNVRERLSVEQVIEFFGMRSPALTAAGLPIVTFGHDVSLHVNGEDVEVVHLADAHTDGDAVVRFDGRNVIHAGDLVFLGTYPFIDLGNGGSVRGFLEANERVLAMMDDDTKLIPGHGPVAGKAEMEAYVGMLRDTIGKVEAMLAEGKSRDEILAAKPTAAYDDAWSTFIQADAYVGFLVDGLSVE